MVTTSSTPVRAALVYRPELAQASLRPDHPLKLDRPQRFRELAEAYGLLQAPGVREVVPEPATVEQVRAVHDAGYVEVVERLSAVPSAGRTVPEGVAARHGFSAAGDNPPFPGMFDYYRLVAGASLAAVQMVHEGAVDAAFNPAGGVNHHAQRSRASGFGVFNDAAIALAWLRAQGLRAAYVDLDVHHGDGVEAAFADTDEVLTISLHESTQFLFPGPSSGFAEQTGDGQGRGFAVNVPLAPYTDDTTWLWAFEQIVPPLLAAYQPDIVLTQLGADGYYNDPLAHMQLTTHAYETAVHRLRALAPRWAAVGGGGYDLAATVRIWTLAFAVMADVELPDTLPTGDGNANDHGALRDPPGSAPTADVRRQGTVRAFAEDSVHTVQRLVFPVHGASSG